MIYLVKLYDTVCTTLPCVAGIDGDGGVAFNGALRIATAAVVVRGAGDDHRRWPKRSEAKVCQNENRSEEAAYLGRSHGGSLHVQTQIVSIFVGEQGKVSNNHGNAIFIRGHRMEDKRSTTPTLSGEGVGQKAGKFCSSGSDNG